jgi:tetratricopeptide (TPR) repeat protein
MTRQSKNSTSRPSPAALHLVTDKALRGPRVHEPGTTKARAQELALSAMSAGSTTEQLELAVKALVLDPRCTDALIILADVFEEADDYIEAMHLIVMRAADDLGPELFERERGHFWELLETRPYMRARFQLVLTLRYEEELDQAIGECEGILDLNPRDNLGCRFVLLELYVKTKDLDKAASLLTRYPDDGSALFAWSRVLLAILKVDPTTAETELHRAREANRHVEGYLTGTKHLPEVMPGSFSPGDVSEAIACALELGDAWADHSEAVRWLKEQKTK